MQSAAVFLSVNRDGRFSRVPSVLRLTLNIGELYSIA